MSARHAPEARPLVWHRHGHRPSLYHYKILEGLELGRPRQMPSKCRQIPRPARALCQSREGPSKWRAVAGPPTPTLWVRRGQGYPVLASAITVFLAHICNTTSLTVDSVGKPRLLRRPADAFRSTVGRLRHRDALACAKGHRGCARGLLHVLRSSK